MEKLYILLIIVFAWLFIIWLRYKYIEWKEDREFWKQVYNMIKRNNDIYIESFKKALEELKPFIIDMINNSNKPKTL